MLLKKVTFCAALASAFIEWQTAQKMYANAKLSPSYPEWKFRDVLEDRIASAPGNVAMFNAPAPSGEKVRQRMMIVSPFSCMACHQQ